jgi:DNA-binding transcriptional MerR regulator
MSTQTYSISDLSRELDITTRAIRFYEEQGLLSPERRGLERIYSARDKVSLADPARQAHRLCWPSAAS